MHKGPCAAGVFSMFLFAHSWLEGLGMVKSMVHAHTCVCVCACVHVHACIGVCVCTGTPVCAVCMGTCGRQRSILGVVPQESLALILIRYFYLRLPLA